MGTRVVRLVHVAQMQNCRGYTPVPPAPPFGAPMMTKVPDTEMLTPNHDAAPPLDHTGSGHWWEAHADTQVNTRVNAHMMHMEPK